MDLEFNKNEDAMKMAWSNVKRHLEKFTKAAGKNRQPNKKNATN